MATPRPWCELTPPARRVFDHVVDTDRLGPATAPVLTAYAVTAARYAGFVDEYRHLHDSPAGAAYRDVLAADADQLARWADVLGLSPAARTVPDLASPPLDPEEATTNG